MKIPDLKVYKSKYGFYEIESKEYLYVLTPESVFNINILFEGINMKTELFTFEIAGKYNYLTENHKLFMIPIVINPKYNEEGNNIFSFRIKLPINIPPSIIRLNIKVEYYFIITNIKYKKKYIITEPFIIKNTNKCDSIRADKILKSELIQLVAYKNNKEDNEITWLINKLRENKFMNSNFLIREFTEKKKEYLENRINYVELINTKNNYRKKGIAKNIKLVSENGNIEIAYSTKLITNNKITIFYNYNVKFTTIQFLKIEKSWHEEIKEYIHGLSYLSDNMIRKNLEVSCSNIDTFYNDELSIKYGINFIFDNMEKLIIFE